MYKYTLSVQSIDSTNFDTPGTIRFYGADTGEYLNGLVTSVVNPEVSCSFSIVLDVNKTS